MGRKDKIGFAAPDEDWLMSQDFVQMAQEIFSSRRFEGRRYWKSQKVMQMLDEHTGAGGRKRKNHSEALWRIINVELWMRAFIDKPAGLEP